MLPGCEPKSCSWRAPTDGAIAEAGRNMAATDIWELKLCVALFCLLYVASTFFVIDIREHHRTLVFISSSWVTAGSC